MDYSKQVEILIGKIAIFAIKTKNLAPNSIMYNFEQTRLMEAALTLQTAGRSIDARLYNSIQVPNVEIEDFKHEWKRVEGTLATLLLQLEVDDRYSQSQRANAMLAQPGPTAFPAVQARPVPEGRMVVPGGAHQDQCSSPTPSCENRSTWSYSPLSTSTVSSNSLFCVPSVDDSFPYSPLQ